MEHFAGVPGGLDQGMHWALGQPGFSDHQQLYWGPSAGAPTFLARTGLVLPTNAWAYCMDPSKWERLKAILSHINPSLSLQLRKPSTKEVGVQVSLWLCKPSTKEVGVQVSLREDRSLQCSLGPLTLHSCSPWGHNVPRVPLPAWAPYSPESCLRGSILWQKDGKDQGRKEVLCSEETIHQQQKSPQRPEVQQDKQKELCSQDKFREEDALSPGERQSQQAQGNAYWPGKPNFQFLEQKYGYFHCRDCKHRWESAYVWCISGTSKVYFKQLCSKCHKSLNPYQVEAIQCQTCSRSHCSCPQRKRHTDLRKPHRQELCSRCKDKRVSCGNIPSFK